MAIIFRQLFEKESSTYTYLLADKSTKEALIIDPVQETMERDLQIIKELDLNLKFILETHIHADHITASGPIGKKTGAKIVLGANSELETADTLLKDAESVQIGQHEVKAILTPGHTDSCASYFVDNFIFTGDTLLIRGCGRTDFQQGNAESLFASVREKLFQLPDETLVYPGHDYKGRTCSSIAEEKRWNPRLNLSISLEEFISIMSNLKLSEPKKIDIAVPANLKSGL